ncbi:MAG TPA: riboflavin synthase [Saprospiraceae bacterium]|nr:riboflavin synthase [Saprospiraceae bacterium]
MFTGIIEHLGKVKNLEKEGSNLHITIESALAQEAYIDQSIAHNGVCLTIVSHDESSYVVTAIQETLDKKNLGSLKIGDLINLERSMLPDKRMDGHFVQGHVDTTATCIEVAAVDGSWYFHFELPDEYAHLVVSKGSICINGTSLTCILHDDKPEIFSVAIIPYTFEHTNFSVIKAGDKVNLEFDILGKYVTRYFALRTV